MLWLKAWRDTLAHKGQFLALISLVSLGIMSYVTFQNSYFDLERSLSTAYTRLRISDINASVTKAPLTAARHLETLPGVTSARVRTVQDVGLMLGEGQQATARIISMPDDWSTDVSRLHLVTGRLPDPAMHGEALIHPKFAAETSTDPGDRIDVRIGGKRTTLRITGIATDPENLYPLRGEGDIPSPGDFAIVYVTESEIERLFQTAGSGNDVLVTVQDGARIEQVRERVEDDLGAYTVLSAAATADLPGYTALQGELDQNRIMAQTMPALVLAISAMSIFIALSRLVQSQRGEIGLAKALGYSDAQILGHYIAFALIIAAGGSLVGVGVGLLGARGMASTYVSMLGLPFLENGLYARVILVAVALAVSACIAAAIVPAWASARLAPAIAMHADPNRSLAGGRVPLAERILHPVLPSSFTWRIPLRNVFRARRRSLYTVLGIAFAMVLSVMTMSMFDSMDFMLVKAFRDVERWDVLAVFEQPFGQARITEVRHLRGVERVQYGLTFPIELSARGKTVDLVVTAMNPQADFHGFTPAAGARPEDALAAGDLVIAASTAEKLGIAVGSAVQVDSPLVDDVVTMRVGSTSEEMLGQPVFVSLEAAAALVGKPVDEYNAMYLAADPRLGDRISDELYDMAGVASVQVKAGLVERLKTLLEMVNVFGAVLFAFGSALAFVVIYTTFTANVTERTREIATMRTIGEDNAHLAVMVTVENLLLAAAALPLGIWLGVSATEAMFQQFETTSYSLPAVIYPASVAKIVALMVGVLLLSEIPPVRRIFRLDLAEATKVME